MLSHGTFKGPKAKILFGAKIFEQLVMNREPWRVPTPRQVQRYRRALYPLLAQELRIVRPRTVLILALLVLIGVFALLNWQSFTAPTNLNFLIARIEAPLGILMLMTVGVLVVVFLLVLAKAELSMMMATRKGAKELEKARKLAAEAESSRVEGLRTAMDKELAEINKKLDVILSRLVNRSGME
jgi:uncharacterized integral membrane protein